MNDSQPPTDESFQTRVHAWMLECFGETIAADHVERNHRFIEEALELVQANGCSQSEAHQLVDYVYGRPIGEDLQEVGGVMVTLAALCNSRGIQLDMMAERELARVWTKIEKIRAKHAAKPQHSPLPAAGCLVPPDSGSPTEAERLMCEGIAGAILAAIPAPPPPQSEERGFDYQLDGMTMVCIRCGVRVVGTGRKDDPMGELIREPPQNGEQSPRHLFDSKSELDVAQIAFETVIYETDETYNIRDEMRFRLRAAIAALDVMRARIREEPERFKCNCPHEVRSGCSESKCPYYIRRTSADNAAGA